MMDAIRLKTGLTDDQIEAVIRCFNGIHVNPPHVPEGFIGDRGLAINYLLQIIRGESSNAHAEIDEFGIYMETGDTNPEQPYGLDDLVEKISSWNNSQALCLIYFVSGWWACRSDPRFN